MTNDTQPKGGEEEGGRDDWAWRSAAWAKTGSKTVSRDTLYNPALMEAVGIQASQRTLDIASGTGEPSITIAQCVGATGFPVACDFSPEMLGVARGRALALDMDWLRFTVADMHALPFATKTFDAVTCRFGLMSAKDPVAAAAEARRVLRPGRKAAWLVWGPFEENTEFYAVRPTVMAFLGEPVPTEPPRRHRFGAPGTLTRILEKAGFADVEERKVGDVRDVPVNERSWQSRVDRALAERNVELSQVEHAELDSLVREKLEPWRDGDVYRMTRHAWLGIGVAPN